MFILLLVIFTLFGTALGSFLNVCIDRLPLRKSLVYPPSHCDACQRPLSPLDLIPILSYLWLRGRCRYCRAKIPRRVPLVESLTGIVFFLSFWRFVYSPVSNDLDPNYAVFILTAFWSCLFLVIIFVDWEHQLILNKVTYPAAIIAIIILAIDMIIPDLGIAANLTSSWPESGFLSLSIVNGLVAGAIGSFFFLVVFLINPRGMGMGDIKLAGLIGLVAGFPLFFVALLIGILLGGAVAIVILLMKLKGRKDVIPYGTFLAVGPIVTLLWGNDIFNWYMNLM